MSLPIVGLSEAERSRDAELDKELEDYPLGSLNLPPLLDERRIRHRIPKCFFDQEYVGDHCLVFSLDTGDTYVPGGTIVKTAEQRWAEKRASCRGILVGAGLTALDTLRSYGMDLGHQVVFVRMAPYHPVLGYWGDGGEVRGVDLLASDIRASADLAELRMSGALKTRVREIQFQGQRLPEHYYELNGAEWSPVKQILNENYVE